MKNLSDKDLVERIKSSDQKAFSVLYDRFWEDMFAYAQAIIMDENNAKDIVQEVWIDYWNRRHQIENKNIKAYLFKAIKFKIYNFFRDNKFNKVQLDIINELPSLTEIEEQHNLENVHILIVNSIENLSPRCKEIFTLSKLEGYNNDEIATQLGISKRTVENQLSLALKKVKIDLQSACLLVVVSTFFTFFR